MANTIETNLMHKQGYLTTNELAECLEVHLQTVYNWIKSCDVEAEKVGSSWWISTKSVVAKYADTPLASEIRKRLEKATKG